MSKKFDKIAVVEIEGHKGQFFVGLYDLLEKWDLRWNAGLSGYKLSKDLVTIIKEFEGYEDDNQIWEFEKSWIQETAPKPQDPCARLGVVAPNGDFYPCGYACHRDLCDTLGIVFFEESKTDYELQREGWIIVSSGACFGLNSKDSYTQEQKETILKIVEDYEFKQSQNPEINWNEVLSENPENYSEEFWSTPPAESWRGDNYPAAMRESYELNFDNDLYRQKHVSHLITPLSHRIGEHSGD